VSSSPPDVCIVLGTFNRLNMLKTAVSSIRRSVGVLDYRIVVVDGGSTDGSCEWLAAQSDVVPIFQKLPLTGAVKAFNLGFTYAVHCDARHVCILNDDDELIGPSCEIETCVAMLDHDEAIGAVAFETDLRGDWSTEEWNGRPYSNKGVVRRAAGMAAARAAGDPEGCSWWSRDHHTYAADTECGLWIWRLGWSVVRGLGLRVHDAADPTQKTGDPMHLANVAEYTKPGGSYHLFYRRWNKPSDADYNRADAERFGGRVH
jgi:glycosyltransferase involved in cell wall biosynthesis